MDVGLWKTASTAASSECLYRSSGAESTTLRQNSQRGFGDFARLEREIPVLRHQRLPEAPVFLLVHQFEPGANIDVSRRVQVVLRPECKLFVTRGPCETDALVDQTFADAHAAGRGLDQ